MYYKIEGDVDYNHIIASANKNIKVFADALVDSNAVLETFYVNSEVEMWRDYYFKMHPAMILNEEVVSRSTSVDDLKNIFQRFFGCLNADVEQVTICDPYILARTNDINVLFDVISSNVLSKKVRFIYSPGKEDNTFKTDLERMLVNDGFDVTFLANNSIHDRYWYTRINGFTTGSSFNGLLRKDGIIINKIENNDLNKIINLLGV